MEDVIYDLVVIGGGQGGIPLAFDLAEMGWKVALVEKEHLGGSCVNYGCTPTKAAIASARIAHLIRRSEDFGINSGAIEVDFEAVIRRAKLIASGSRTKLESSFDESQNPRLVTGHARFKARSEHGFYLETWNQNGDKTDTLVAKQVVIDTGAKTSLPQIPGLASSAVITAENWLDQTELPAHPIVLGGGYIGLEMGQFYRRMGSDVTIINHSGHALEREDDDIADAVQQVFYNEGIRIVNCTSITGVVTSDSSITVTLDSGDELRGSHLFVAAGRSPNLDIAPEKVGLKLTHDGFLQCDNTLRTNIDGVWACGDVRGGPMFTHTSWDDYRVLLSQLAGDASRTTDRIAPYAVFTDPEIARVGASEKELDSEGIPFDRHVFQFSANGKARELGEQEGFVKILTDPTTRKFLGAAIFGANASELIHILVAAMNADAPVDTIRNAVFVHPTLSEAVQSAVS